MEQQKNRLALFDFDDTLVMTPHEDAGKQRYLQATGKTWPHSGWWGRRETLRVPIFNAEPHEVHEKVVAEFRKAKADPNTLTVLMTGRHSGVKKEVQAILAKYGLEPDEQYYKGDHHYPKAKDTWDYKNHITTNVLVPRGFEIVEIWDDRVDHIPLWLEVCKTIKSSYPQIQKVIFHDAGTGQDHEF